MIDSKVLLKALQKQVSLLEKDLTPTGLADARLKVEWRAAKSHDRTAATFETWLGERVTQVAVAWVLGTVFLRFCEDNGLIEYPFITGPGSAPTSPATFRLSSSRSTRSRPTATGSSRASTPCRCPRWPRACSTGATTRCGRSPRPTTQPRSCSPSGGRPGPDGQVVHDLTDPELEHPVPRRPLPGPVRAPRKTYALLQTPEFVEEFILKYTLDPAIEEFGLTPDPASRPRAIFRTACA